MGKFAEYFAQIPFCKNNFQGKLACINKKCNFHPFVCLSEKCQCNSVHKKCKLLSVQPLIRKLFSAIKQIPAQIEHSFNLIQSKINEAIDQLSKIRQELLTYKDCFGLQQNSTLLYFYLTNQQSGKLSGKVLEQVKLELELQFNLQQYFPSYDYIKQSLEGYVQSLKQQVSRKMTDFYKKKRLNLSQNCTKQITKQLEKEIFMNQQKAIDINAQYLKQISKETNSSLCSLIQEQEDENLKISAYRDKKWRSPIAFFASSHEDIELQVQTTQTIEGKICQKDQFTIIRIQRVSMDPKTVKKIIKNSKQLAIVLQQMATENQTLSDDIIKQIGETAYKSMKILSISSNSGISGKHLSSLFNLKVLSIQNCRSIDKQKIKQALRRMKKLTHLKLYANKWVDDKIIEVVAQQCKRLRLLNIQSTGVTEECIESLKQCSNLTVLSCGYTQITGNDLVELTSKIHTITKLDIQGLDIDQTELRQICENSQITQLKIGFNRRVNVLTLTQIKGLKLVKGHFTNIQAQFLREAKINAL